MGRLLITTALEKTWRFDEPASFLGGWCRLYERRELWSKMDADVVPYHWDDRAKLQRDYDSLQTLYEALLVQLSDKLNEIHGTSHSQRFWRILVGPWLNYFVGILFDRWETVRTAAEAGTMDHAVRLTIPEREVVPSDMRDFLRLIVDDLWNHVIYARLIGGWTKITQDAVEWQGSGAAEPLPASPAQRFRRFAGNAADALSRWTSGSRDAFFLATYLRTGDDLWLQLRLAQIPKRWRPLPWPYAELHRDRRKWTLAVPVNASKFESIVRVMIPEQLPTLYLEGFHALRDHVKNLPWPTRPKVMWTSNAFLSDETFKGYVATKVERGSPLVVGQHGGHYGVGAFDSTEDHQVAISESFLTWGWGEGRPRHKPVGMFKSEASARPNNKRGFGLLVGGLAPRYPYRLFAIPYGAQWEHYFEGLFRFVELLPQSIQDDLLVRLFPADRGWGQRARWRDRAPNVRIDDGRIGLADLFPKSRVCIATYNATTYLESISIDLPTIMFWDPRHWELRDSAKDHFADLARVGVFHESAESASRQLAGIWDDIDAWWRSAPVRAAVDRFALRYCRRPPDLVDRLERELRSVARYDAVSA